MRRISALVLTVALAFAGLTGTASASAAASRSDWTPPPGYTFEASYLGGQDACDQVGRSGVSDGSWSDYVCHEEMRKLADLWLLFGDLYVKR